jgi:hypothetical protein
LQVEFKFQKKFEKGSFGGAEYDLIEEANVFEQLYMINCMRLRWVCVRCGWGKELVLQCGKLSKNWISLVPITNYLFWILFICFCFRRQGYTLASVFWSNNTWKFAIHNPSCISMLSQTFKHNLFITNWKEEKMKLNVQLTTIVRNWIFFWNTYSSFPAHNFAFWNSQKPINQPPGPRMFRTIKKLLRWTICWFNLCCATYSVNSFMLMQQNAHYPVLYR